MTRDISQHTLDPDDWDEARALGHRMLDDMFDYLMSLRERPAWVSPPPQSRAALDAPTPMDGAPLEDVYRSFKAHILPYPTGNQHPGFFGWVMGNGTPTGMLADMLASGMNPHLAGYDQSAPMVEKQVISWFADLLGFPPESSGLLVSGGTMANLNALAVARCERAGFDIRSEGLSRAPQLTVYGGAETHNWIVKACELTGLGSKAFRKVPCGEDYATDVKACRDMIRSDIEAGCKPFCLIATVGTVNTGASDDVAALRALADEFGLWLHVDGAFGALAALAPEARRQVEAQSLADSIAFDLHKWGYQPYEIGCVIIRDAAAHKGAFAQNATYISSMERGLAIDSTYFADRGLQLSRGFRALKAWMLMKETGADKLGALIQQNVDLAQYLAKRVDDENDLERMAPAPLNIVCFRYVAPSTDEAALDALNQEILYRIQESGEALPSHTMIKGRFCLRACVANHRTRKEDIDKLIELALRFGREIAGDRA